MKAIEPIILDTTFKKIGIIDDYISLIWATRYYTVGEFELCVDVNKKNNNMLKKDYYITRQDDDNVGIIESIEISQNDDKQETLIVTGRFLSCVLSRRIIEKQTQVDTTVSSAIYSLIWNELINPSNQNRKINNFYLNDFNTPKKISAQYTGKNLLTTIEEICTTYGLGYKTVLTDENKFLFKLYEGTNRSYDQSKNPYVVFSDRYDNLLSSKYKEVYKDMVTDVLVAGEGEGLERKTLWVTKENLSGLARYEMYQDQRDISTNDGEVNDIEYRAQLTEEGLENITTFTSAFEGTAYFDNIAYKKDVFVGDICVIENTRWGMHINSRLIEVIESIDESGTYSINPTFGI